MLRRLPTLALPALLLAAPAAAAPGAAAPARVVMPDFSAAPDQPYRAYIIDDEITAAPLVSNIIFLNRCVGGCVINGSESSSDARTNTSSIPMGATPTFAVAEFSRDDDAWNELVSCVQTVFAPYDVVVTDVDPGASVVHHEAIVAGLSSNIGWPPDVLGVGTVAGDCSPYDNGISFSFANAHATMQDLCHTVAQEAAHTYGLDHELLCADPMTYIEGCGPKYFRNLNATCGEDIARPCRCSGQQNSHATLNSVFGPNPVPLNPPVATVVSPTADSTVSDGFSVFVNTESERGVSRIELWINGFLWETTRETDFTRTSGTYTLSTPNSVPDSILDLEIRTYNDLGTVYDSDMLTVTKGAACAAASDCAEGQACSEGRCFWDPPTGQLGDACEYPQFCESNQCRNGGDGDVCTQECTVGIADTCPEGLACAAPSGQSQGYCFEPVESGCCSTGEARGGTLAMRVVLGALVFGLVIGRRRRRVAA